jgi:isopentenyl-diphosphate delta-isomerase
VAEETRRRKSEHIKICLTQKAQARNATTGFEDINFVHCALPEINKQGIDLSTHFLGHKFKAPLIVGAMTGGTPEAEKINSTIAETVEKLGLGMGVGSQRAAIEDPSLAHTFDIARRKAPTAFLIANIGAVQLAHGYGITEVRKAIEMIGADAVAIHLNALQEVIQPEGQPKFRGIVAKIAELATQLDVPLIVKETGAGIAAEEAKKLEAAGVKAIDIGGVGGTNFAAVEHHRANGTESTVQQPLSDVFCDWGIPTAPSLIEVCQSTKLPVIASGGVRTGADAAKALAIGAKLASVSQPVLKAAVKGNGATENLLLHLIEDLQNIMFLVGAEKVEALLSVPLVVTGKTEQWLSTRGFNTKIYAKRGVSN